MMRVSFITMVVVGLIGFASMVAFVLLRRTRTAGRWARQREWRRPRFPNRRQQRGAIISQRSGIVDAAGIPVGQDVRGVGDVVEKFTGAPQVPG